MPTERADAVIIGSGYGGTIPATRLAEAGMRRVIVLERGRRASTSDLRQSDALDYQTAVVDLVVSSQNIAFRTGKLVGGASIAMDGAMFRVPRRSFDRVDSAARRNWPERYTPETMAPYYERVEAMFGVRRFAWSEIPKAGGLFAKMLSRAGASCDRARMNYGDCLQCGFCAQGCIYNKKHTLLHTYIPRAERAGAEFRAGCGVSTIERRGALWAVNYSEGAESKTILADIVFVAGGGLHTPALLLRSRAAGWSFASEHVGEHFNHNGELQFFGVLPPEFDDLDRYKCYAGMDNAGLMSWNWFESDDFTLHPGGGIEPTVFAAAVQSSSDSRLPRRAWGMEFKRWVESVYPHRVFGFSSLGLADSHSAVTIKADGSPDVVARPRESYDRYLDRLEARVQEVARATNVAIIPGYPRRYAGMTSAHLLASCRMSERAEDGVVDPFGQVWGQENLFVCDASAIPYALGVNPALTISAVAERVVDGIINPATRMS
ncbi:MAG: GMC family oxidoreductase [Polyangiales bacterium]